MIWRENEGEGEWEGMGEKKIERCRGKGEGESGNRREGGEEGVFLQLLSYLDRNSGRDDVLELALCERVEDTRSSAVSHHHPWLLNEACTAVELKLGHIQLHRQIWRKEGGGGGGGGRGEGGGGRGEGGEGHVHDQSPSCKRTTNAYLPAYL